MSGEFPSAVVILGADGVASAENPQVLLLETTEPPSSAWWIAH